MKRRQYFNKNKEVAYVTQTTLSIDDTSNIIKVIKDKYKNVIEPSRGDICYATTNRQNAVKDLTLKCDIIFVVGSENSSNSNRLKEISTRAGCEAILIDEFSDLDLEKIRNVNKIAITAGASAPEDRVQEIALALRDFTGGVINEIGKDEENIVFKMPPELRKERVK